MSNVQRKSRSTKAVPAAAVPAIPVFQRVTRAEQREAGRRLDRLAVILRTEFDRQVRAGIVRVVAVVLFLAISASPALAQEAGRAHPVASECSITDADCIVAHDGRVMALATTMGIAAYCGVSTRPAACLEAVAMTSGEYEVPAAKHPAAAVAAGAAADAPTYLDMSGPAEPEAEFPTTAKKGAL